MKLQNMNLVDFHCHLDLYPDFPELIQKIEEAKIYTLTMTTTPKAWPRNKELTSSTKYVRAALGLHPQLVAERGGELQLFEKYLSETRYVGEVGLDASPKYYSSFDVQRKVFERILCASSEMGNKVLSVHSVRSTKIVLDYIERFYPKGKIVLHWFTGSLTEAKRAVDIGCYFSINSAMLGNKKGKDLITSLPVERLLTETDGPFVKINGRIAKPFDVREISALLASNLNMERLDLERMIQNNLRNLTAYAC